MIMVKIIFQKNTLTRTFLNPKIMRGESPDPKRIKGKHCMDSGKQLALRVFRPPLAWSEVKGPSGNFHKGKREEKPCETELRSKNLLGGRCDIYAIKVSGLFSNEHV